MLRGYGTVLLPQLGQCFKEVAMVVSVSSAAVKRRSLGVFAAMFLKI